MIIKYCGITLKIRKLKSGVIDITIDAPNNEIIQIDTNSKTQIKKSNQNGNSIHSRKS
tara:strand:- start:322 stop:495 length:174 start_codon:yes stop_codon:yes gene_type:complete